MSGIRGEGGPVIEGDWELRCRVYGGGRSKVLVVWISRLYLDLLLIFGFIAYIGLGRLYRFSLLIFGFALMRFLLHTGVVARTLSLIFGLLAYIWTGRLYLDLSLMCHCPV